MSTSQSKNQQGNGEPQEVPYHYHAERTNAAGDHGTQTIQYTSVPREGSMASNGGHRATDEAQQVAPMMQRWLMEDRREKVWDNVGEVATYVTAKKYT